MKFYFLPSFLFCLLYIAYNVDIFPIKKLYSIVKDKPIKIEKIKTKNAKSGVSLIDALIYLKNSFIILSTTLLDYCLSIVSAYLSSEVRYYYSPWRINEVNRINCFVQFWFDEMI